jgi:hypothetical protein
MCLISGGNWNNTSNAGVWNLNLNNNRTNSNANIGLRCADYDRDLLPRLCGLRSSHPARGMWSHRDVPSCRRLIAASRRTRRGGLFSGSHDLGVACERQGAAFL